MKEQVIHIGDVKIPLLDYAVSCNAILGIRDSGKTVTAKGIAEQLLDHDVPIVVFDAVGKWRWMKVPGAGARGRGYKVVVAGGRDPDLALNPHSVGEIVRSAVKEKIPLIIDLYDPNLSKADWRRIVQQSIRIIHYEASGVAHVFLEEAAEYIPQKVMDTNVYAEVEKLARMGGNASVGLTIINQRSQEVNKAVLDLAHNLILGCQIGHRAIDAVEKWVDRLSPDTADALTTSLPHLKSGEAWVWTRTNPDDPKREQIQMCRSLHPDRRTPEVELKSAKAVDPEAFVKRLQVAIPKIVEEAKANDPGELKKTIGELRRQISKLESSALKTETVTKTEFKEKKVIIEGTITRLEKALKRGEDINIELEALHGVFKEQIESLRVVVAEARKVNEPFQETVPIIPSAVIRLPRHATGARSMAFDASFKNQPPSPMKMGQITNVSVPASMNGDFKLSKKQQEILNALAWFESIGNNEPSNIQLGAVALVDTSGGYFSNMAGPLSTEGLIIRSPGRTKLTEKGRALAEAPGEAPTLEDYHGMLRSRLRQLKTSTGKSIAILDLLILHRGAITTEEIGKYVGVDHTGGYFSNSIGPLSTLGLIVRNRGLVEPTEVLFPPGLS